MTLFDANEKVEFLATQSLHYDRYVDCQYYLERVNMNGKCGLVCGEESAEYGTHSKVLLESIYDEINISKIATHKAIYDKYAVFGNGEWGQDRAIHPCPECLDATHQDYEIETGYPSNFCIMDL